MFMSMLLISLLFSFVVGSFSEESQLYCIVLYCIILLEFKKKIQNSKHPILGVSENL